MRTVNLTGRLTRDPSTTKNGGAVISLANNDRRKDKETGEYKDIAHFFGAFAYGKTAEYATSYLKKGDLVEVSAQLNGNRKNDDGHTVYELSVQNLTRLVKASGESGVATDEPPF